MKITSRIFAMALAAALQACVTPPIDAPRTAAIIAPQEQRAPVTILVSIDGFRPDYLQRKVTPNLNELAASGISGSMRPSFPSITFPNHWTLVTGLRPDRHGVVGNRMEDTAHPGMTFTMQSEEPFWWTQAEPIWITAEKAGIRSATMFWPGANVDFSGVRPQDWQQYGHEVSNRQRVDAVIDWLRRPAATRPRFLTLYFDTVDSAGHMDGPDGLKTNAAVAACAPVGDEARFMHCNWRNAPSGRWGQWQFQRPGSGTGTRCIRGSSDKTPGAVTRISSRSPRR